MQFPQFSSCGLPIILVCWFGVNEAVPYVQLGSYPGGQVRPTTSSQPKTETVETTPIAVHFSLPAVTTKSVNARPNGSTDSTRHSSHFNNQDNISVIHGGWITESHRDNPKTPRNPVKAFDKDDNHSEIDSREDYTSHKSEEKDSEKWKIPENKGEVPDECPKETRRKNQFYTRSIPPNASSFNLAEDLKVAGEAETKKTSSVHVGEEIALCWIETTTIKEDPEFNPPKRLVTREFTISFENSVSIPENYLDCDKLEGEIVPGDDANVGESALREVIDENTKRSREVNFTRVGRTGGVIVRQRKKVKCGAGTVMSKDIFEWPDGTDNPKKRVEIKVGPSIRKLGTVFDDESAECTTKSIPKMTRATTDHHHGESSSPDCTSSEPCETWASRENGDCGTTASTVSTCENNDCSARSLSEETASVSTTRSPNGNEVSSTGVSGETTATEPTVKEFSSPLPRKPERDEDDTECSERDTDCISPKTTTDQPKSVDVDKSGSCSGEDVSCASKEESTSGIEGSVNGPEESVVLDFGDEETDERTVRTSETSVELSDGEFPLRKDSECGGDSGECSVSSQSFFDDGEEKTGTSAFVKNSNEGSSAERNRVTELPLAIGDSSAIESVLPCDGSATGSCSTVVPDGTNRSDEVSNAIKEYSSRSDTNDSETGSSSCDIESDEGCRSAVDSSNDSVDVSKSFGITADSIESNGSERDTVLPTSEKPETVTDRRLKDRATVIPITESDEGTLTIKPSVESMESVTPPNEELSLDKGSVTKCFGRFAQDSGDCSEITVPTSSSSSAPGDTTLTPRPCESSGNCGPTDRSLSIDNATEGRISNASICESGEESCESPSSTGNLSEEDGSAGPISQSCAFASGSCSSDTSDREIIDARTNRSTPKEFELRSTIDETVSTTAETRRSGIAVPTTPLSSPTKGRHRLALRIKVLLEHIDENKVKEQLVQVERHLLLNEKPSEHGNHSLTLQLQSLNNSMTMETLKAIFNCTTLENLSRDVIDPDESSKDAIGSKEFGWKAEGEMSLKKNKTANSRVEDSVSKADDSEQYSSNDSSGENSSKRKKREIFVPLDGTREEKNISDRTKEMAILKSLPGVEEDFQNGMDRVLFRISRELDGSANIGDVGETAESSSSKILKILSDPSDDRIHSLTNPKRNSRAERVVKQRSSVNSEQEIERWSNERFVGVADGGEIRSLTEFRISRDHSEDSRSDTFGF